MSQAGALGVSSISGGLTFIADSGTATPSLDTLHLVGDGVNIATSASGSTVTFTYTGGAGSVASVQGTAPIQVNGDSGSPHTGAITVSVTNATTTNVGVASFNTTNFSVTAGAVTSKNFTITAGTGLSGGGALTLGGSATLSLTTPVVVTNGGTGTTTQFTQGSVVFAGASGVYSQDNSNFFWNASSHRLGLGTTTPLSGLDVTGNVAIGSYAGSSAAPINGMIISGAMGVKTNNPQNALDINGTVVIGTYAGGATGPLNGLAVSGQVGVGTSSPASSAALHVSSTSQGFLPPVMSQAQRNAIASPTAGLIVYNTTDNQIEFYNGTTWLDTSPGGVSSLTGTANQISVSAPSGDVTVSLTNGLSLGSYQPNAPPTGGLVCPGRVGIGTSSPDSSSLLEVSTTGTAIEFITSYGTNIGGKLIVRGARGTQGSPSQPLLNDVMGTIGVRGYQSDTSSFSTVTSAGFDFVNAQNGFTSLTNGTEISVFTTPVGSVTPVACTFFTATQDVLIGTGTLSQTSINGFAWISYATGAPNGIPGNYAGYAPLYWDDTNKKLYVYSPSSAAWKGVQFS